MLKFVVILSFAACALGAAIPDGMLPQMDGRIVGGTPTTINNYPYQVSIHRSGSHSCGGSVVNAKVILSAAHCFQSVSAASIKVRAGSTMWNSGGSYVNVAAIRNHANYNANTMVNDIAILHLSSSLPLSGTIRAIAMSTSTPGNGANAVVTGWGTLTPGGSIPQQLQRVDVKIISADICRGGSYSYGSSIKSGMICAAAAGKDSCQGDSGGPLAVNGVQVGVVSWGISCASAKHPGVYTNVADFNSWINSNK